MRQTDQSTQGKEDIERSLQASNDTSERFLHLARFLRHCRER